MLFKGMATGLSALGIAFIMIFGCEKSTGPEPSLCSHQCDSLLLIAKTDEGQVPMGPAIALDSLKKLIITDTSLQAIINMPEYQNSLPLENIRKIIFK